ncbi:MAG: type II toxin-antitoxin system VapC family toxin [Deltaproteobacteria bacterium]|nr:type II toxin-antitoxin system VapC family toxin [Deltaproteobacteria bacterium]
MATYVLDTSVAIAWYLPEAFSSEARQWQRRLLNDEANVCVPSLHYWEFGNVLRTYVRRGELQQALAQEIYQVHLEAPLVTMEPDRHKTLECAFEYDATMYDAVYIALSRSLDAALITAEKTTRPWVVKLGDNVRLVSK